MANNFMIVNYGMGNLRSVANALTFLKVRHFISSDPKELANADALILPGVGAFGEAMKRIDSLGLRAPLRAAVMEEKKPFLGICLGMQLLAKDSTERGFHQGLGWIDAHVERLEPSAGAKVPHVGWNSMAFRSKEPLFRNIPENATCFFDHSFHMKADPKTILATTRCGTEIVAAIRSENIFATQFHPEKSHFNGLRMIRNFTNFAEGIE